MAMNEETLRQGRILMVDDEVSSLCLLENVLQRLRFPHLRKLTDPTRIIEEFDAYEPDLVITDIEMPDLDGIQLVEKLRSHLPSDACLPIMVLTGSSNPKHKRRALAAGATEIMAKPFDAAEIQMRIRTLLLTRFQHIEIQTYNRELEQKVADRTTELEHALSELKDSQRQVVQQERFRAFGEMAGGVVHDFNNALMSIIGYSELLLQDATLADDRDLLRQYLKTMNTAGRDASQVVSRLRDFYRPREESDVFTSVAVNRLIEEVVPLTKPKWHDHALETGRAIRIELELQKVPPVLGNGTELREIFTNLIFNAVDAMPDGGTITLRTESLADTVKIEVADTGTGMTEEVRHRCLEPFFSTKAEKGTGLGLSMAFGIIRRHSGTLDIETAPGRGSTFRVTLPCYQSASHESAEVRLTVDRILRVLVVDDEPSARDVVTKYLKGDGHRVVTASDGGEAIQRVMSEHFDLVITDHGMPGMSGTQLADAVHRFDPEKPVFLLTGFAYDPAQLPASVQCLLKKPLVPDELRSALQKLGKGVGERPAIGRDGCRSMLNRACLDLARMLATSDGADAPQVSQEIGSAVLLSPALTRTAP
jgi:signal transduction histidine kinase